MLCEFILNSTRSPPGEEFLYHILLELYLTGSLQDAAGSPSGVEADSAVQSRLQAHLRWHHIECKLALAALKQCWKERGSVHCPCKPCCS